MAVEIVTAAAGIVGKMAAKPVADAAMRQEKVIRALKTLRLDPRVPPRDFHSLYAYTLIEYCAGRAASVLAFFRDEYVVAAFHRSFSDGDWGRLRREADEAVARNRETLEFGHLDHGFEEHVAGFTAAFQSLVDRSRAPHETRLEQKVDDLLEQVRQTRLDEESHRARTEPGRSELSPAQRLMQDVHEWFTAVGYEIRRTWEPDRACVALLVDIPQRRPGRFDRTVMLCVEGELLPHHMRLLGDLVEAESAAEGWGLARLRISEAARRQAEASDDVLFCYSFDELIDLEADFEPYIDWIEEEVRRRGVDTRYVPVSCHKEEIDPATRRPLATSTYDWKDGGLDGYVAGWLQEPTKRHLSVLGEFGMGKTWFALHLAGEMARGWRDAKRRGVPRPRIPLLIPLRDYAKQTTVQGLLSEFFFNKHKINLRSYDVFRVLNRMGRLLLIFDGFDEMAARADRHTVIANFWELAGAVEPGAKVLLSSRKEHFRSAEEARELFDAKVGVGATTHVLPEDAPTFDIVELDRFDDEQIETVLRHDLPEDKVRLVMDHADVRELLGRAVMFELVIDALPEIEQGAEVDLARIYLYAVQRKMDRDVKAERTFTSRADKLFFLCEVSAQMLDSNELTLNYRDFPERLRACFGSAVQNAKDLDFWEQDMRNQGMLVRNGEGDYGPAHKSLLEFFVAFKYAAELGVLSGDFLAMIPGAGAGEATATWSEYFAARPADGKLPPIREFVAEPVDSLAESFGMLEWNEAVFEFLKAMARERVDRRERLLEVARATGDRILPASGLVGNCLALLALSGDSLEHVDLRELDLHGFRTPGRGPRVSFAGADLRGASLVGADFSGTDLSGADLTGARWDESLLDDGWHWRPALCHSDGSIAVGDELGLLYWPGGRLDEAPVRLPVTGDPRWVLIYDWDASTWWYRDASGGSLVDVRTGAVVRTGIESPDTATPTRWRGDRAWADIAFSTRTLVISDADTGAVVENVRLPELTWSSGLFLTGGDGVLALVQGEGQVRLLLASGEASGETAEAWRTIARDECAVQVQNLVIHSSHDTGLLALDDRFVAVVDALGPEVRLNGQGLDFPVPAARRTEDFVFRAASGMAALAMDGRLYGWRLGDEADQVAWRIRVPGGTKALRSPRAGDRLLVLTGLGELWSCDFRTGEILSRTTVGDRLRGTRFSRDCGLDPDVLEALVRVGGVVVD
ncbi:pentapeptide repeat-containing protein [Streptomyces sp. NPDC004787]|uniref:NACHT domain-containing protein n=1 Tax=Streptomyces sp. NPDC004787 TaxID=3154291 RepID=UPI0033A069B3